MSAPEGASRWARIPDRGSVAAARFGAWCYRHFGAGVLRVLADLTVTYFFLTDGARRRASLAYLRRVHATPRGRERLGHAPTLRDAYRHYWAFKQNLLDRAALWMGDPSAFEFDVHGFEPFERLAAEKRGAIIVGSHLGSFDALRLLAVRERFVANVLMYVRNAPVVNSVFRELSPETEMRVIPIEEGSLKAAFEIRSCLDRGELVAILADRVEPQDRSHQHPLRILGGEVRLPTAAFELALLLGCPLFMMTAIRRGPLRYEVFIERLSDAVRLPRAARRAEAERLLEAYAGHLERLCQEAPFQWFNFYDYWGDERPAAAQHASDRALHNGRSSS